jgi:peptide/nickel transport system substrate-binding protein
LALCLNREGVIHNVLYDMTGIPQSYVPTDHPLYAPVDSAITAQDTEAGKALLEAVGWTAGEDGKRFSRGVAGVPDGTELRLSLAVPQAELYHWMLEGYLAPSLADCGFAVDWQETTMLDLYAPGPEGLVFGRQFDLALITWFTGNDPACSLYLSDQIPAAGNYWVGVNAGGYASAAFDAACQSARQSRLDDLQTYVDGHAQAQRIFTEEQPAIPLYYAITAAASRLDLCGYELDASTRSDLWNLESWDVRDDCIPQE